MAWLDGACSVMRAAVAASQQPRPLLQGFEEAFEAPLLERHGATVSLPWGGEILVRASRARPIAEIGRSSG